MNQRLTDELLAAKKTDLWEILRKLQDEQITTLDAYRLLDEKDRDHKNEIDKLNRLLNTPELDNFDEGVKLESGHQIQRWGEIEESKKPPHHFIMVVTKLLGKLTVSVWDHDSDKFKHHCITLAAVMRNCHRQIHTEGSQVNEWFKSRL